MTYKDVIDRFQQVANQHYMIKDFGYGQLSDIKVHSEDGEADYPYLFLNPTTHTRTGTVMTYEFNMIMMDIAIDEDDPFGNWINIQSQCQQYIDDVFAQLYYGYTDQPLIDYSNVTYTPFKERFQDSLAGMTAAISIEVPTPIDQCIAPFTPIVPPPAPGVLVLDVNSTSNQTFSPDVSGNPQAYPSITTDTYNAMRPGPANFYYIQSPTTGNWVFTETGQARKLVGTEPFIQPRLLTVRPNSGAEAPVQPTTSTFPTNSPIGTVFNYTVTWELELDPSLINYVAIQDYNDAATEPQYETLSGLNLTATFQ